MIHYISYNYGDSLFDINQIIKEKEAIITQNKLTVIHSSSNGYVIGKLNGDKLKDVSVMSNRNKTYVSFVLEGTFSKSQIEAASTSGEIFNTLNYLNK